MNLVTIDQLRRQCRTDSDEDTMLTVYGNAAEAYCAGRANRNLYATADALAAAVAALPASMAAAQTAYDDAIEAADALDDDAARDLAKEIAARNLFVATIDKDRTINGMVANEDVIGAVLMAAAHFYRNRESVATGQGAAALQVPMTTNDIMDRYRCGGPL